MNSNNSLKHLSVLGAWAFAFGCAIGSDVLILPWTTFLPTAGPLGSLLGLAAAVVIMLIVVWNFHYMINRCPGTGGVYSYATKAFGHDHGYLCAWFLLFAYAAIVWADATALMAAVRYMLGGDVLHFGFHYSIAGYTVCMGDVVIAFVAMCISVAFCLKRRVAGIAQSVVAVALAAGVSVMFVAALLRHGGGAEVMRPLFSPDGPRPVLQVLGVLSISPWLFIGVESISTMSAEFRFPLNRSFGIMAAATGATAVVYVFAMFIPILAEGDGSSWVDVLKGIADPEKHALDVARNAMGGFGTVVLGCTLAGALFSNLIGNAFKFTESGHVEMRASFDATAPDVGVFRFAVEDTGCGISERDLGSIGSAYVQVGSRVSRNGGTGLGLAICKELIVAMGGELHVESKLGEGSTFSVVIPGVKVAAADAVVKAAAGENAHVRPAGAFIVRRILVVDDSKMNLMVLKAHLKCIGGFEVVAAADGQEALEALSAPGAKPFDLVLTDMWMPRLDGSEVVKAMRANPALAHTRTIVVTADVEFQSKYKDMGFDGILLKPITQNGLADVLAGRGG